MSDLEQLEHIVYLVKTYEARITTVTEAYNQQIMLNAMTVRIGEGNLEKIPPLDLTSTASATMQRIRAVITKEN